MRRSLRGWGSSSPKSQGPPQGRAQPCLLCPAQQSKPDTRNEYEEPRARGALLLRGSGCSERGQQDARHSHSTNHMATCAGWHLPAQGAGGLSSAQESPAAPHSLGRILQVCSISRLGLRKCSLVRPRTPGLALLGTQMDSHVESWLLC